MGHEVVKVSAHEVVDAAKVRLLRVGGGGDGPAHHDVVRADAPCLGGGHDALLVPRVPAGKAHAGGDGDKARAAVLMDHLGLQRRADHPVQPGGGCVLGVANDGIGELSADAQLARHDLLRNAGEHGDGDEKGPGAVRARQAL